MQQESRKLPIGWIVTGVVGLLVLILLGMTVSTYNYGVRTESALIATADDNEQYLGQFYNALDESVQVTDMYAEDFREIATGMLAGRYGEDGSQASFQVIREEMPMIDREMYSNLQDIISTRRNGFQNRQSRLVDQRRSYENSLYGFPSGMLLSMFGFPKRIDLDDPRFQAISTEDARQARETGLEEARQIGG